MYLYLILFPAAFKRKDQEFDELMDVKIMLDLEIRAYRSMLEDEEARLGYMSPAKKRKRTSTYDNDQGAVIFNPQEAENTEGVAKSVSNKTLNETTLRCSFLLLY